MLATPLTVCAAMRVKSGPPPSVVPGGAAAGRGARIAGACTGAGRSAACDTGAVPARPVTTSPAVNPATMRMRETKNFLIMALGDVHAARSAPRGFRHRQREETFLEIGRDRVHVDRLGQHERARETAVAAFDAVGFLTRRLTADTFAADHDPALFRVNLDVIAAQAGDLDRQDERVRNFVEVDRRGPAKRVGAHQLPQLVLEREEIAPRIPSSKGHVSIVAWVAGLPHRSDKASASYATIASLYSRAKDQS